MKNARGKAIDAIIAAPARLQGEIEGVRDGEQDSLDNMPESLI